MCRAKIYLPLLLLLLGPSSAYPHPLPRDSHDRNITVRLQDGPAPGRVVVHITYRLEVNEATVWQDMIPYKDEVDAGLFAGKALQYHAEYTRKFADIIAANLDVFVGPEPLRDKTAQPPLALKLIDRAQTLTEDQGADKGKPLGHLRCTFVFEGDFPVLPGKNYLRVRERNFRDQESKIYLSFENRAKLHIIQVIAPDPELNKLEFRDQPSDFDKRLRNLTVCFDHGGNVEANTPMIEQKHEPIQPQERNTEEDHFLRTFREIRESHAGMLIMLLVFAGLGAAHALTPGHGKTLVAAYLVGEHGTLWHAATLGLVTTITHTGVVLIIALVFFFLPETMSGQARQAIQTGLGLVLGISVTCLGFWLLLQRLSGGADHIHLASDHGSSRPANGRLGWWGIIVLGVNGGLIPCWDAVAILVAVVGSSEFWLALPALLAFSAGLAGVLVLIGILVVQFRNFAGSKWGEGRFVHALPLISAALVTGMGVYLSYASIHQP